MFPPSLLTLLLQPFLPSQGPSFLFQKVKEVSMKQAQTDFLLCLPSPPRTHSCHHQCRVPGLIAHTDLLCSGEVCSTPSLSWPDASLTRWKRGVLQRKRPELEGLMHTLAPGHRRSSRHYRACQPPHPPQLAPRIPTHLSAGRLCIRNSHHTPATYTLTETAPLLTPICMGSPDGALPCHSF